MSTKNHLKLDYLFDISIKILYFSGRLIKERSNLDWIPGWLISTLGINGCAVGINTTKRCIVYLNGKKNTADCTEVALDDLHCFQQNSCTNRNMPCPTFDCQVRQRVIEKCGQPGYEITCFPMSGKHGFFNGLRRRAIVEFLPRY